MRKRQNPIFFRWPLMNTAKLNVNFTKFYIPDELKHVLGSETTRIGLYNFFEMLQHSQLNKRLVLVLFHHILTTIFSVESMEKHAPTK